MKKYFVTSDIHSNFDALMTGLNNAGFDLKNKNHVLVIAGDLFDRCGQTLQCFEFVKKLQEQQRLIFVKGNHETLFFNLLNKPMPQQHDYSNGTVRTFCHIARQEEKFVDINYWLTMYVNEDDVEGTYEKARQQTIKCWKDVVAKVKMSGMGEWLEDSLVDFVEIGKYVIVHSFVPKTENWRYASWQEWEDARWQNPFDCVESGYWDKEFKQGKILIFGHWFNALQRWYQKHLNKQWQPGKIKNENDIYLDDKRCIGLDACTALSNKVNVFVIEEK